MGRRFVLSLRAIYADGLGRHLVGAVLGSSGLRIVNLALNLGLTVFLARTLRPEGYGVYAFAFSLVTLLAVPAHVGLPNLVVREVARNQLRERWNLIRGLLSRAHQAVFLLSAAVGVGATFIAWVVFRHTVLLEFDTYVWAVILIPFIALSNVCGATLRGFRRVIQGQLSEMFLRPGIHLLLVAVVAFSSVLTPQRAMALHALAAVFAFVVSMVLVLRALPLEIRTVAPTYDTSTWLRSLLPLSFLAGMQVINSQTDIVMLGLFTTSEEVGIYRVTVQGASLVVLGLQAVNMVVAPHFARLYASDDQASLQQLVSSSARGIFLFSLPVLGVFVFYGEDVLRLAFGSEFSAGYPSLVILGLGQLANAAMGSVGILLNMTGHERDTARVVAIAAGANIVLNLILIPPFGMNGAALASAITLLICNILLWSAARNRLGINSTAFSLPLTKSAR